MKFLYLWLLTTLFAYGLSLEEKIIVLEERLKVQEKRLQLSSDETTSTLGGRVQFDMVFNRPSVNASGGSNLYDYYITPTSFTDNAALTKLSTQVKNSRLWFKTQSNTSLGILRSLIEIDFYGSNGNEDVSNSHNLRLRHAYVSLNSWTVGQTSSTFMGNSLPDLFLLSSNVPFVRQSLVKYTFNMKDIKLDVAFENPETTLVDLDSNSSTSYNDDTFFDTVVRARYEGAQLKTSLALILRTLNVQENNQSISNLAWGLNASAKYRFKNNNYIQASFSYGEGLGRYLALGYYDAGEFNHSNILLIPLTSGHLSYTHRFSKKLRSTILASFISNDTKPAFTFITKEKTETLHLNLRYVPLSQTLLTLEYIKGQKIQEGADLQSLDRIVASFSYIF